MENNESIIVCLGIVVAGILAFTAIQIGHIDRNFEKGLVQCVSDNRSCYWAKSCN